MTTLTDDLLNPITGIDHSILEGKTILEVELDENGISIEFTDETKVKINGFTSILHEEPF